MTERIYYTNADVEHRASVVSVQPHEDGLAVVLDRTPFHPQGGGQPADRGTIAGFSVRHVFQDDDEIYHVVRTLADVRVGQHVTALVDLKTRRLNARYHTAGHLIAAVAETLGPLIAVRGHHWPDEAKVEFLGVAA